MTGSLRPSSIPPTSKNPKPHSFSKWTVVLTVKIWLNREVIIIREERGTGTTRKEAFADLRQQLQHNLIVAEHLKDVLH